MKPYFAAPHLQKSFLDHLILAFLYVCQFYYWYRYPLQYNQTGTSPTYSDTPAIFQAGKYGFFLLFLALAFSIVHFKKDISIRRNSYAFLSLTIFLFLLCYGTIIAYARYVFLDDQDRLFWGSFLFLPYILLFYASNIPRHPQALLSSFIKISLFYHIAYSFVMLALFFIKGRLPALAYEGGIVRFGGGWDDPNCFGVFSGIMILLFLSNPFAALKKSTRTILTSTMILLQALTLSASSIGGTLVSILALLFLTNIIFFSICSLTLASLAASIYITFQEQITNLIEYKQQSLAMRLNPASNFSFLNEGITALFFGSFKEAGLNENFFLALLNKYGFTAFFCYMLAFLLSLWLCLAKRRTYKRAGRRSVARYYEFLFSSLILILVASNGIPYIAIFPINIFTLTILCLTWASPAQYALPSTKLQISNRP